MSLSLNDSNPVRPSRLYTDRSQLKTLNIDQSFANLDAYLKTWKSNQGLNGIIATWWSSTLETIEPHPMNQAPYIFGQLALNQSNISGDWIQNATSEADCIISKIQEDGILSNGWGDVPGAPKAPVIGLAAVGALYATAHATNNESYILAADRVLQGYEKKFASSSTLNHYVSNQNARWALTKLQRYLLLKEESDLERAIKVCDRLLKNQIKQGRFTGGILQSDFSDVLISVYGGKCIYPLVAVYENTNNAKYLEAAKSQANMLLGTIAPTGQFFPGQITPAGPLYTLLSFASKCERRLSRNLRATTRLRRLSVNGWDISLYPIYIARAADTIRGFGALAVHCDEFRGPFNDLLKTLLDQQHATGGFPNSTGYFGVENENHWQDIVPSTRWNVYVFQLLADLLAEINIDSLPKPSISWPMNQRVGPHKMHLIVEDVDSVQLSIYGNENTEDACRIQKRSGSIHIGKDWTIPQTKTRTASQMSKELADMISSSNN